MFITLHHYWLDLKTFHKHEHMKSDRLFFLNEGFVQQSLTELKDEYQNIASQLITIEKEHIKNLDDLTTQ